MFFSSLSPCGRFIGFADTLGELLIFDMVEGHIQYHGDSQTDDGNPREDGIWVWLKDLGGESGENFQRVVKDELFFWEIGAGHLLDAVGVFVTACFSEYPCN
ncbi:hypothetical protein GOP47_0003300 [Adiantum capillus-veneris]|uniref:Uncharacterized protein n=1 Tax=Adiantum capillus-veneris TaxID=13818 RepID=A0A9D4ZS48_ADICA|nr:hypothetical protein GOP47_0003300 [Adiantum capillus-veneris]